MKRKITAIFCILIFILNSVPVIGAEQNNFGDDLSIYESSVTASDSESGNGPTNAIDGDLGTKWAAEGSGQWFQIRLEEETVVEKIGISFTNGHLRVYSFRIDVSLDGNEWTTVFSGKSSGTTSEIEYFELEKSKASIIRFVGQGSNVNAWNNINEFTGVTPKKIYYNFSIDGFIKVYETTLEKHNDEFYISVTDVFSDLNVEYTVDENAKTVTVKKDDADIILDYKALSVKGIGSVKEDIRIHENGTYLISSSLLSKISGTDINYIESEKTLKVYTDEYDRILEAYSKIDEYYLGVFDWLVSLYDPESGGFYNSVSGATYEGFYPSLEASGFVVAMLGKTESGAIAAMPEEFRQKLLNFFLSCQNPDTGFFEEPWPKAANYNERAKMRVIEQVISKINILGGKPLYPIPAERNSMGEGITDYNIDYSLTLEEALSDDEDSVKEDEETPATVTVDTEDGEAEVPQTDSQTYSRDKIIELPEGFPSYCASVNMFIENAASRSWSTNSWTAGDLLYEDLSYILMLDESLQKPYIDAAIEWLNEHQDPETGYWAQPGDIGFNAVSGAFKVVRIYDRFGIKPPNAMKIAESILATLRGGYQATAACYIRNPISTLEILCGYDAEIKRMLRENECEIVERYADYIKGMFHEDGGASSKMYESQPTFGGMDVGLMICEGDMDGTQQMWLARQYLCNVFGRNIDNSTLAKHYDEFWNKIMTKEKIVKKKYDATPGVVYEQNFENVEDVYSLTYENWGFETAGSTLESKTGLLTTDKYLRIDDKIESDVYSDRKSFGRIYGDFDIECSLMFDRNGQYKAKGDDMSYSVFRINSGILSPIRINAIDSGADMLSLQVQHMLWGSSTYVNFATVEKGEWFDIKISGGYDKNGKLHYKLMFNGKHIPALDDMLYDNGVGYIDGIEMITSGARKSVIGLDNIKITAY